MQVTMPWLSDSQCIQKYSINPAICICAGETGGNKDTCQGDSGGPLVVLVGNKWMLGGLTSFGRGCNDGGVYARTSNYYNWILQNLQQDQTLTTTTSAPNRKLNKYNENKMSEN
jgi:secreted trypsin-like serine protease